MWRLGTPEPGHLIVCVPGIRVEYTENHISNVSACLHIASFTEFVTFGGDK
jgi:hypothetical protein